MNVCNVFIHICMNQFSTCKKKQNNPLSTSTCHISVYVDDLRLLQGKSEGGKLFNTRTHIQHKHRCCSSVILHTAEL